MADLNVYRISRYHCRLRGNLNHRTVSAHFGLHHASQERGDCVTSQRGAMTAWSFRPYDSHNQRRQTIANVVAVVR